MARNLFFGVLVHYCINLEVIVLDIRVRCASTNRRCTRFEGVQMAWIASAYYSRINAMMYWTQAVCEESKAMRQIEMNGYAEVLKQDEMQTIHKYAIACYKKSCEVVYGLEVNKG